MSLQTIFVKERVIPKTMYTSSLSRSGASTRIFFYEPGNDYLVLVAMGIKDTWPGWELKMYVFNAETGIIYDDPRLYDPKYRIFLLGAAYCNNVSACSGMIISTFSSEPQHLKEVNWYNLVPSAGMFQLDRTHWAAPTGFIFALLNPWDKLIAVVENDAWNLNIYDYANANWTSSPYTPPVKQGSLHLPGVLSSLAWESRDNLWLITNTGIIAKANYRMIPPRWEILSTVQAPEPTCLSYKLTYDTKRKRVVVFRRMPDTAPGQPDYDPLDTVCRCKLEFYRPIYKVLGITEPVPVSRLRCGEKPRFISHIYGDAGEGAAAYLTTAELLEPAQGTVLSPHAVAELNGLVTVAYQAPDTPGTDTLKVSASIPDGETPGEGPPINS